MKRIKPYNTRITSTVLTFGEKTRVNMPRRAQVLAVRFDVGGVLWLSVASFVDSEKWEAREFVALLETDRIPQEEGTLTYIGLAQSDGGTVMHVFEINSPEDNVKMGAARGVTVTNHQEGPVNGPSFQVGVLGGGVNIGHRRDAGVYVQ